MNTKLIASLGAKLLVLGKIAIAWLASPIGVITAVATATITVIRHAEERMRQMQESARLARDEAQAQKEITQTLDGQIEAFKELNNRRLNAQSFADSVSISEEMLGLQQQISETIGEQRTHIDLANGAYEEQLTLLQNIRSEQLRAERDAAERSLILTQQAADTAVVDRADGFFSNRLSRPLNRHANEVFGDEAFGIGYYAMLYNMSGIEERVDALYRLEKSLRAAHSEENNLADAIAFVSDQFSIQKALLDDLTTARRRMFDLDLAETPDISREIFSPQRTNETLEDFFQRVHNGVQKAIDAGNDYLGDNPLEVLSKLNIFSPQDLVSIIRALESDASNEDIILQIKAIFSIEPELDENAQLQSRVGAAIKDAFAPEIEESAEELGLTWAEKLRLSVEKGMEAQRLIDSGIDLDTLLGFEPEEIRRVVNAGDNIVEVFNDIVAARARAAADRSLQESLASLRNETNLLSAAIEQQNTTGRITAEMYNALVKAGVDLGNAVSVVNGQLVLNVEAIAELGNTSVDASVKTARLSGATEEHVEQLERNRIALNETSVQLSSYISNIESVIGVYNEFVDTGVVTLSSLERLQSSLGLTEDAVIALENAFASGNREEVIAQLERMVSAYIANASATDNLTDAQKDRLIAELELMGVSTSRERLEAQIAANALVLAANTGSVTRAMIENAQATWGAVAGLQAFGDAMARLERIRRLQQTEASLSGAIAAGATSAGISTQLETTRRQIENELKEFENALSAPVTPEINWQTFSNSGRGGGRGVTTETKNE